MLAAVGGVALVLFYVVPSGVAAGLYLAFGLASVAALCWLVLWGGLTRGRRAWGFLAASTALMVAGDIVSGLLRAGAADGLTPFPSASDALYFASYPLLLAAIISFARLRRPRRDVFSVLDGIVVAAACAVPLWVVSVAPSLDNSSIDTFGKAVAVAYPLTNLLVIATAVRFLLGSGRWNPAAVMLGLGLVANIGADILYNVSLLAGTYSTPSPIDAGWLLSYLLWALAALHPSATSMLEPGTRRYGVSIRARAWILVAIVVLPVVVIAVRYVEGTALDWRVVMVPACIVGLTLALRLRLTARGGSAAWRGPALLSIAALTVVTVAMGLGHIQTNRDHKEQAANGLWDAVMRAERVDGMASRALSLTPGSLLATARFGAWRVEVARLRTALDRTLQAPAERARTEQLADRYVVAVEQQYRLAETGRRSDALKAAESSVRPAHEALIVATERSAGRYAADATRNGKAVRLGSVLALTVALLMLGLLFMRFGGLGRKAHLVAARNRATLDSERRFRALVEGSADILTVIDANTTVLSHADSVERVLGYADGTMLGTRLDALLDSDDADHTRAALAALADRPGDSETLAWPLRRADGSALEAEASIVNHLDDPLLGGFVVNVRDVTDRNRLEAELEHQAFHDGLTGLPNRALVVDRLRQALARSVQDADLHAMVMLDIEDFKAINDSLGHPVGDELLQAVAGRLAERLGPADTLARVGSDEFAILLEGVSDADAALEQGERLLEAFTQAVDLSGYEHKVTVSIGVSVGDGGGLGTIDEQANTMLRDAELAMYEAKRHGGGGVELFADHMHDAVSYRLALKAELVLALRREEFKLVYQPIVSIDQASIVGYEALVRWIHPQRGMVSPAEFIPVAEQTGLIVDLGTWVLREATRQLAVWQRGWVDSRYISVNVAGEQLQQTDFTDHVKVALRDSGLPAEQLLLEVTESSLIDDIEGSAARISELRALGARVAIDDFGTGYSSLSYLHRFAVDVLKIDKSFIDDVTTQAHGGPLVEAIVNMATSLGLVVVAEGIEERDQVLALAGMACAYGQGYHYSRPLPVAEVSDFVLQALAGEIPGTSPEDAVAVDPRDPRDPQVPPLNQA